MTQIISSSQHGANIVSYETWVAAIASSACIGFTSLVPWLFNLTFFEKDLEPVHDKGGSRDGRMKFLLSFAVGAILGDIFFHLIPESYQSHLIEHNESLEEAHRKVGLSIIGGIFMFIIVEAILEKWSANERADELVAFESGNKLDCNQAKRESTKSANRTEIGPIFKLKTIISNGNCCKNADLKKNKKTPNIAQANANETKPAKGYASKGKWADILDNNNSQAMQDLNGSSLKLRDVNNNEPMGDNNNNNNNNSYGHLQKDQAKADGLRQRRAGKECNSNGAPPEADRDGPGGVDSAGYLNLIANGFDNFTHGLAIGASFLIGLKVGFLTTFVIIIHEIPHEICDYAILVNSGFSRWEAVKAQSSVSLFGIIGTAIALYVKSVETLNAKTHWILPFSAGSFLYIALVNLMPELLDKQTDLRNSLGQLVCVLLGILFMALVAIF